MKQNKTKVKNEKMVRDNRTTAILSVDVDGIASYEKRKREIASQKDRINNLETELASLKEVVFNLLKNGNNKS